VWMSWPQACITPGFSEAKSRPVTSVTGSASMSPRKAIAGASARSPRPPMSTMQPVPGNRCGSRPASVSFPTMKSVVANSLWDSSGCAWR
jgi:hypothetical protein